VVHSPLVLLKRKQEPSSALVDQCFAEAKHLFAKPKSRMQVMEVI